MLGNMAILYRGVIWGDITHPINGGNVLGVWPNIVEDLKTKFCSNNYLVYHV